ncbi:MAG TPA: hypothetical protein VKS82_03245 [Streptosporangiaceae bacterium]|nr:hypothetical protein [Streptosporangiaceae bacterium]
MRARSNMPGLDRRGFLTASAAATAGLGAAGLAAPGAAAAIAAPGHRRPGQSSSSLTDAVLAALRRGPLVALGEAHILQEHHDVLQTLLSDPRLPGAVDDIVVEFGNALYQDTIDKFILDVAPVNDADLRLVWRNTTQSPVGTWDNPVYEQFFRRVRAVNWTLPPGKRIRVLAGDLPIDWSKITTSKQLASLQPKRDPYAASVVEQQVLAKGRRALICYGIGHVVHDDAAEGDLVVLIQQRTGVRSYVILDLVDLPGLPPDPGSLYAKLASYPRGTVIPAAGTWLGKYPHCGGTLRQMLDAGLYLGQPAELTASWPDPAIYLNPAYWAELHRRNALWPVPVRVNLNFYRQQQPPGFPLGMQQVAPAC